MAKMEKGIFGSFSGKIGNVVGYVREGKQFIRNIPKKRKPITRPCSLNMAEIVTGDYPNFKIDYHKEVVTKGSLFHSSILVFKVCLRAQPPSPAP